MPRVRFPSGVFGSDACRIQYSRLRWCSGNIQPCQHEFFFFVLGAVIVLLLYFSSFDRLSHVLYIMAILNVLSMQWQKEGKKKAREGSPVGPFASLSVLEIATVDINTFYCAIHANGVRLDVLIISLCGRRRPETRAQSIAHLR